MNPGSNLWGNAVEGNTGNNATAAQQGFSGSFASFQSTMTPRLRRLRRRYKRQRRLGRSQSEQRVFDCRRAGTFGYAPVGARCNNHGMEAARTEGLRVWPSKPRRDFCWKTMRSYSMGPAKLAWHMPEAASQEGHTFEIRRQSLPA